LSQPGNPIFIGGVPRSGTTLLRVIFDSHPRVFCGTELRAIQALATLWLHATSTNPSILKGAYRLDDGQLRSIFADLVLAFLQPAWSRSGKARVAEKTPSNLLVFPQLRRIFPDSALIHVIRDGRDVVASRLERDRDAAGPAGIDRVARASERAREWAEAMRLRRGMLADAGLAAAYQEVRYEELVRAPETALRRLFAGIGEPFDPVVLSFHRQERNVDGTEEWSAAAVRQPIYVSSIGRWRTVLNPEMLAAVMTEAREELAELGYVGAGGTD
jgi:hypothetical protein